MMRHRWRPVLVCLIVALPGLEATTARSETDFAAYVDPFIGTAKSRFDHADLGSTFPGATAPFGMVQWSPDTDDPHGGGYNYASDRINGFSVRHLSGPGCPYTGYGDFPFLPSTSAPDASTPMVWDDYAMRFSHDDESARPGAYEVRGENGIDVQLSAGTRFGVGELTFPGGNGTVLFNAGRAASPTLDSAITIESPDTITGEATSGAFCYLPLTYHVYFAARFDRVFASSGTWGAAPQSSMVPGTQGVAATGASRGTGAWVNFDTASDPTVRLKVAISYVSRANALSNLDTAISWDPNAVEAATRARWNELLGRIDAVGGSQEQLVNFYSALYHVLLQPSAYSDANGEYLGYDGAVHIADGYTQYTDLSLWDTYRSAIQLQALIAPRETSDIVRSLLADAKQGGFLPRWGFANYDTGIMVGDPADAVIASAYAYGARDFDARAALAAMLKGATQIGTSNRGWDVSRPGLKEYLEKGYVPRALAQENQYIEQQEVVDSVRNYVPRGVAGVWGPTATTMEYGIADFAIAQFARAIGDAGVATLFDRRAQSWQHVFDASDGYPKPREPDGTWSPGFATDHMLGFVEGNATQYNFMVPHNVRGVIDLLGGDAAAIERLDHLFTRLNVGPKDDAAWLGNEPAIGSPYAYLYAGAPWKTQALVRRTLLELYAPIPGGIAGNDDLGSLSAEYVWGALGMHPGAPGSTELLLSSPLFPSISIAMPNGGTLQVHAPGASAANPYVHELTLDGVPWSRSWLPLPMSGAEVELAYTLGEVPALTRGVATSDRPSSWSEGQADAMGFVEPAAITMSTDSETMISIAARNTTNQPRVVTWEIAPLDGITFEPSRGTLPLDASSSAAQLVRVRTSRPIPGDHVIRVHMVADDGATMPRVVFKVTVPVA